MSPNAVPRTPRSAPPRATRAEKQAQTRADLIDAASRVFARRGYRAATVEEIAERAGYSHGAVYSNFASKEELFLEVFERYMDLRIAEVAQASDDVEGSFAERARAAADQWMGRFGEDRETFLLHLEFMIHAARDPALSRKLGLRMAALRLDIERRIGERADERSAALPLSPAQLALIVRALGIGLAVEALNAPGEVDTGLYGEFVGLLARVFGDA